MSKKILDTIERAKRMKVDVLFEKAMTVTTAEEAGPLLEQLIEAAMKDITSMKYEEAKTLIKENLGYMAGYYSHETRERVERLFDCEHPVFGKIAEKGPPTMEEAFKAGVRLGEEMRKRKEAEADDKSRN